MFKQFLIKKIMRESQVIRQRCKMFLYQLFLWCPLKIKSSKLLLIHKRTLSLIKIIWKQKPEHIVQVTHSKQLYVTHALSLTAAKQYCYAMQWYTSQAQPPLFQISFMQNSLIQDEGHHQESRSKQQFFRIILLQGNNEVGRQRRNK